MRRPMMGEAAMADDYQMLEELGSGSFGVVYKAVEKSTGELVAIKHIDLEGSDDDIREIQQEISLLSTCSSDHVTRYKASFVRGVKLWIVMEFLGGGSCLDLLRAGPFGEAHISIVMRELLLGLDYLHSTGKIHRDIKAANVLLSDTGLVKIADFGVAAQLTNIKSQRLTFVGTPFWMAPEVIQEAGYDFKADIWSLGITAMELALGAPPHSEVHPMKVLFLIPKEKPPRLEGGDWSRDFRDFVAACLNKEAERRPTAKALLKHRFIQRAGRVETLKSLVDRAHSHEAAEASDRMRYYQETLHDMNPPQDDQDDDDWVFDTIKPVSRQRTLRGRPPVHSYVSNDSIDDDDDFASAMEQLDLSAAPLGNDSPAGPEDVPTTVCTPKYRDTTSPTQRRRSSVLTSRRVSASTPTARRVSRQDSVARVTARRVLGETKQPLGLDMSFGNGTSTVRQFRRVSSANHEKGNRKSVHAEQSTHFSDNQSDTENRHPRAAALSPPSSSAPSISIANTSSSSSNRHPQTTKEAVLGRRAWTKCLDPALQECHASTAPGSKQAALARVADALAALDETDPEGELLLLKAVLERVQADPKLSAQLLPARVAAEQLASLRAAGGLQIAKAGRPVTPPPSPQKASHARSQSTIAQQSPSTADNASKLVLAPQNPHLQSLKRQREQREQQREREKLQLEEKMPGSRGGYGCGYDKDGGGLQHVAALSEALYTGWCEGLRARWAGAGSAA